MVGVGGGTKKKKNKRHPHWCPELFCMIRPQRFGVYVVPPSKMEPFAWHDQRRLHQGGISGGTNVDVPRLIWQLKPSRLGESQRQEWCVYRPEACACVREKRCSNGGRSSISHEGENKRIGKMESITPGPCGLPLVPLYGFRCTSVHKTQTILRLYQSRHISWVRTRMVTQPLSPHATTDTLTDS